MKVAIIGYGKMGKAIEEVLIEKGHEIICKINQRPTAEDLLDAEVAIEFSHPEAAFKNIQTLLENNIPTISGTTGWLQHWDEICALNQKQKGAFLYASNFSLGVNLFFELNAYLAKLMAKYPEYRVEMEEIHHTQKLDKPSGTAITLAEQIIAENAVNHWESDGKSSEKTLPIYSKRIDEVPGTHTITYQSNIDEISLSHVAHSRKGFAKGAVLAAEWLIGKQGIFSMKDVLNLD